MRLRGHPTIETLGVLLAVFGVQQIAGLADWRGLFVLALPLAERPWTIVTSVYAHAGVGHLLANALALAVLGPLVARRTTRSAFHGYFLATGAVAGIAEVTLGGLIGQPTGVLGASGAVFALVGYLLSGNVVSTVLLDRFALSTRAQLVLFVVLAVVITLATGGSGSALFGHAAGLVVGLLAGRAGILDDRPLGRRREEGARDSDRT